MKRQIYYIFFLLISIANTQAMAPTKYLLPANLQVLHCSRSIMLSEVGTKEKTGKNDGPQINKYLESVGIRTNAPYCAAFVFYCFDVVTLDKNMIPITKTAVANQIFSEAKKLGIPTFYSASIDDLIVWKYSNSWSGHIERIFEVHKAGWVLTVGANTSNGKRGSQREGNGVYIRRRNILHSLGRMYIRGLIGFKIEREK